MTLKTKRSAKPVNKGSKATDPAAAQEASFPEPKRHAGGRPTLFRPEYVSQAKKLTELGATNIEIADFFGVDVATIYRWQASRPEFAEAIKIGKEQADNRVEQSLFSRANGYEHDEVDIRVVGGKLVQTTIRKFYPPDTAAAIFWLKNRKPQAWRDKQELEHGGPGGAPLTVIVKKFCDT